MLPALMSILDGLLWEPKKMLFAAKLMLLWGKVSRRKTFDFIFGSSDVFDMTLTWGGIRRGATV
jgi:hypothetical protein